MGKLGFEEKLVIVTGAGHDLGFVYEPMLAERGCRINVLGTELASSSNGSGPTNTMVEEIRQARGMTASQESTTFLTMSTPLLGWRGQSRPSRHCSPTISRNAILSSLLFGGYEVGGNFPNGGRYCLKGKVNCQE